MKYLKNLFILTVSTGMVISGCGKKTSDTNTETASEIVSASISGAANQSENAGVMTSLYSSPTQTGAQERWREFFSIPSAQADNGSCSTPRLLSCDDSGAILLTFDSCHLGAAVMSGSEKLQFSSLAVCMARTAMRGMPTSGNLLRTFGGTLDDSPTTRTNGKRQVIIDSSSSSGYSQPVSGGEFVEFSSDSNGNAQRTVSIRGLHLVARDSDTQKVFWDHSIATDSANPLVILKAGKNRQIVSGATILQHNLAKFIARSTIKETLTFSDGCCHPTGGSIETVFEGSKTGTETVSFTNSCGNANLKAADGSQASIELRHCF